MGSRYDVLGQRVRSARKPIVARSAPSPREAPYKRLEKERGQRVCIVNCGSQQRECQAEAIKEFRAATKECRDERIHCITKCKEPIIQLKKE